MEYSAIDVIKEEECTGCFGCCNTCKFNAINMSLNNKGFYVPNIDREKCTKCQECKKCCPVLNSNIDKDNEFPKAYAGWSKNDHVRLNSSSGGVFTEIANYIIDNDGVVFGASWDENCFVQHIEVRNKKDISKLRGSKYIQSNLDKTYNRIKSIIENENKKVLFVGTPCQVAGLKNIINNENLITIDLVCHGIASIEVFHKYLEYEFGHKENIKSIVFRDKENGWINYNTKYELKNGEIKKSIYRFDPFFWGYLKNIYLNSSCYNCKFNNINRAGDLTLADYWGAKKDIRDFEKGVSLILVNNNKGEVILNSTCETQDIEIKVTDIDIAINGNPRIISGYIEKPYDRDEFFYDLNYNDFGYLRDKYIPGTSKLKYNLSVFKNFMKDKLNL